MAFFAIYILGYVIYSIWVFCYFETLYSPTPKLFSSEFLDIFFTSIIVGVFYPLILLFIIGLFIENKLKYVG